MIKMKLFLWDNYVLFNHKNKLPVTSFSSLSSLSWNDSSWYNVLADRFSFLVVVRPIRMLTLKYNEFTTHCRIAIRWSLNGVAYTRTKIDLPAWLVGITGLISLWGDVAWFMCCNESVSADRSTVWILSNSCCNDGGPDPESELFPTLQTVSVSSICDVSSDAKPYEMGPDDLKTVLKCKRIFSGAWASNV